jgi:hypothetical protein
MCDIFGVAGGCPSFCSGSDWKDMTYEEQTKLSGQLELVVEINLSFGVPWRVRGRIDAFQSPTAGYSVLFV